MLMRQLVILAGGKGTRLRERLKGLPKPLVDLCGLPLLERQVLLAKRFGFDHVLILVSYKADIIRQYCADKNDWGLNVECIDDGEPRGTAGAVLSVYDRLSDEFLVMYGDTMLEVDLTRFEEFHSQDTSSAASLFLHPNDHPSDSDIVEIDDNLNIIEFHGYPHNPNRYLPNLVNAALYFVRKVSLKQWVVDGAVMDFGKDLFPKMLDSGLKLRGYNSHEYIKDCGTPARIDKVCRDFNSGRIMRSSLGSEQKAIFVDRDGTLNLEVNHLSTPNELTLIPGIEEAIQRLNQAEYRVCVVTNQPVIARGECTRECLKQIHNKLETLLGRKGAYVDRIYYCPHHPDSGFSGEISELKKSCECRKPGIGMINMGIEDLNIKVKESWMIGDTSADMLTAERAGLKSILVETGFAGLDGKHIFNADFIIPNFPSAVDFILTTYPALVEIIQPLADLVEYGEVVFVGGQSRSGKSTVGSIFSDCFKLNSKRCHVISTDRWLLTESERGEGVFKRHDTHALQNFLELLIHGSRESLNTLPTYNKREQIQMKNAEEIEIGADDIVILEGVVALHYAELFDANHQYFVHIDENVRRERVENEYQLRGMSKVQATEVYNGRLQEEFSWVNSYSNDLKRIQIPDMKKSDEK
jgi:histidinol-phosphate phosphatase family protein